MLGDTEMGQTSRATFILLIMFSTTVSPGRAGVLLLMLLLLLPLPPLLMPLLRLLLSRVELQYYC